MRRILVRIAFGVAVVAFAVPVVVAAQVSRTCQLVSVDGSKLPTVVVGNGAGRVDIVAGSITLAMDGSYTQRETRRSIPSDDAVRILDQHSESNSYTREAGTYSVLDTVITFTPFSTTASDDSPHSGTIRGCVIRLRSDDRVYEYGDGSAHGRRR